MNKKLQNYKFVAITAVILTLILSFTGCSKGDSNPKDSGSDANLRKFKTTTLSGEKFTQDDLKSYDMTVVNVWSTTCGYCIEEMPALEKLKSQLPANVQFVTVCIDGAVSADTAKDIVAQKGLTAKVLVNSDSINKSLLKYVSGTPSTFFFDKDGKLVGKPKVGTFKAKDDNEMAELYMNEVKAHLKKINK